MQHHLHWMATVTTHCKVLMVLTPVHLSTQGSTSSTTPEVTVHDDIPKHDTLLLFLKCWERLQLPLAEADRALGIMAGDMGLAPSLTIMLFSTVLTGHLPDRVWVLSELHPSLTRGLPKYLSDS